MEYLPRNGNVKNNILNGEIFENILILFPSIGKWILDSYITVQRRATSGKGENPRIPFDEVKRYIDGDELVFDLSLDNINKKTHWIYKLIEKESELIDHPLVAMLHEFKCKNGGIFWYWIGAIYFSIYHCLLTYVIYQHPPPFMYDCNVTSTSGFICRDNCPDFGIPLKPDASSFWSVDENSCYQKWHSGNNTIESTRSINTAGTYIVKLQILSKLFLRLDWFWN